MEDTVSRDKRVCDICGLSTYRNQWYYHNDQCYCKKCENKLFVNPKWHPITNPKKFYFKGKFVFAEENPRTQSCSKCNKNGRTEMHHWFYLIIMPWACRIELCASCHMTETWKNGGKLGRPKK